MPEAWTTTRAHKICDTLIRDVIQIPARLVRRGRGWVIRAFCDHPMARVLERAQLEVLTLALPDPG